MPTFLACYIEINVSSVLETINMNEVELSLFNVFWLSLTDTP